MATIKVKEGNNWVKVPNIGVEQFPDAPLDGKPYNRKDGAWSESEQFPEAPKDGKQYARKDGEWVEVESAPLGETVKIIVTSNQAQPDAAVNGCTITVNYGDNTTILTWQGIELSVEIPVNMSYTITCSAIDGYASPEVKTYIALMGNTRNINLSYNTTITTINVTSNQSADDFTNAVTVNLTGGITKTLSGALTYTLNIPTGIKYNIVGSGVGVIDNADYRHYVTPDTKTVTAVGPTQTESIQYLGTKVNINVVATEGNINPSITLNEKGSGDYATLVIPSGATTSIIIDDVTNYGQWRLRPSEVTNYITPAVEDFTADGTTQTVTLTYTFLAEEVYAYYVIYDETKSTTTLATGGNIEVRDAIRSKFKRCAAMPQDTGKAAIAYLNDNNSAVWLDGTSTGVPSGASNGKYIMVHFPKYYYRNEDLGSGKFKYYISDRKLNDNYKEERECLVGAYEAGIDPYDTLTSWSGVSSTASKTISVFYTCAQRNGSKWGLIDYRAHKTIANMFAIMYGNTNISTLNSAIPCSGGTKVYNTGNTGGTIALGNKDGKGNVIGDSSKQSSSFLGLEDCYYSKWEFVQGVNIKAGGKDRVVYDGGCFPDKFDSALTSAGATNIRTISTGLSSSGYITKIVQGEYADVMPVAVGGSSTTYYADYNYSGTEGPYIFQRSGRSGSGAYCGVFVSYADNASSGSGAGFGSRLAFYGDIEVKTPAQWRALTPGYNG